MAIKISGTTVINDSRGLTNIASGAIIGIQSAGQYVGAGATTLNFIGAGNSLRYIPATNTIDISISGSGGGAGAGGTGIVSARGYTNDPFITESLTLDDTYGGGTNTAMFGPIFVQGGSTTITVGAGVSFIII